MKSRFQPVVTNTKRGVLETSCTRCNELTDAVDLKADLDHHPFDYYCKNCIPKELQAVQESGQK